jgi:hypothetical protein
MKDMKMKTEIDTARFLNLAKLVLDNCGDSLWDVLEEFHPENGKKTQKFIRTLSTRGEFPDSEMNEFRSWLYDCLRDIESQRGYEYASEEAGYDALVALG